MNLRLLIISSAFPPMKAPESAHALFLCEHLARAGVEVHLLTTKGNAFNGPPPSGVSVHPLMDRWSWKQLIKLLHFIRSNRFDSILLIYIDWIYKCHPMITFLPTFARRHCSTKSVVTQFENQSGLSGLRSNERVPGRLMRTLIAWLVGRKDVHPSYGTLLRDSTHIIALSAQHLDAFVMAYPDVRAKAEIIPAPSFVPIPKEDPGSARRRGREALGLQEHEIAIIYYGYLYPLKGVETLIAAFGRLPANTRLLIVGETEDDVYARSLLELSNQAGRADHVLWMGYCDEEKIHLYLCAADICVLPFNVGVRLNNSSFAAAAAHGLPIVTTRGEMLETPFIDGENVRLCPPKNPAAMAEAINELINCPALRSRLRIGVQRLMERCFAADRIISSTLRLLTDPGQSLMRTSFDREP
jgi:glycosyltransferase involved in cell wall biosynthesis